MTETAGEAGQGSVDTAAQKNPEPLIIYYHWCKACGICISFCPHQVFTSDRDGKPIISHPGKCTQCAICWLHCPDLAIVSTEK